MLAFTMLWAYMSFSQYLIIWSGNLTEEIPWYLRRSVGGWRWVALALIVFHFFVPFFCCLSARRKRNVRALWRIVAALDPVMHLVDTAWLVLPAVRRHRHYLAASWLLALVPARSSGIGGLWLAVFAWQLKGRPLVPRNDPLLAAAIEHHGGGRPIMSRAAPARATGPPTPTRLRDQGRQHPPIVIFGVGLIVPDRRPASMMPAGGLIALDSGRREARVRRRDRHRPARSPPAAAPAQHVDDMDELRRDEDAALDELRLGRSQGRASSGSRSTGRSTWWPSGASRRRRAPKTGDRGQQPRRDARAAPADAEDSRVQRYRPVGTRRSPGPGGGSRHPQPPARVWSRSLIRPRDRGTASRRGQAGADAAGMLRRVGFDQNLNAQVPLDLPLRDETGRPSARRLLRQEAGDPDLVYYECPMLCNEVLNALLRSLKPLSFEVGKEFDVITVSIDPTETPELAAAKKAAYLERYGRAGAETGWHFLTGDEPSIAAAGRGGRVPLRLRPEDSKQYAHPAGHRDR